MALQLSTAIRNAMLDAIESTTGASARLRIRTGAPPANPAAARTGTVLADVTLPADWMAAAAAGAKALSGSWVDAAADATGTAGHFEIMDSSLTTCHQQGTYGTSATDMIGDSVNFTAGQNFQVLTYGFTAPNA